jgi:hypothetical protein
VTPPVLASTATAIPVVCGDAALLVDPLDDAAVEKSVRLVLPDEAVRARLVHNGCERMANYDISTTGTALYDALVTVTARSSLSG